MSPFKDENTINIEDHSLEDASNVQGVVGLLASESMLEHA